MPTFNDGTVNAPFDWVTAVDSAPVLSLLTVTVAPGTKPPPESTTTPVIDEVAVCAAAHVLTSDNRSTADTIVRLL
jgi:hypothetical protein